MLVGRSHECDFPADIQNRPALTAPFTEYTATQSRATPEFTTPLEVDEQVRRTLRSGDSLYRLNEPLLAELRPDLILTQSLCEVCSIDLRTVERVARAMRPSPSILSLSATTFEGVLDDILRIGAAVGLSDQSERLLVAIRERFYRAFECVPAFAEGPGVAFLDWTDPIFIAGHWTPQLIERAGGRSSLNPTRPIEGTGTGYAAQFDNRVAGPSIAVTPDELLASRPDAIILCPCGLSLSATRRAAHDLAGRPWWSALPAVRSGRVALVDGNQMFSRPGPRLVDAFEWLTGWLNNRPELIPPDFPWAPAACS